MDSVPGGVSPAVEKALSVIDVIGSASIEGSWFVPSVRGDKVFIRDLYAADQRLWTIQEFIDEFGLEAKLIVIGVVR
jgi:hypothetical protein